MLKNNYIQIALYSIIISCSFFYTNKTHSQEFDCPQKKGQIKAGLQNIDEGLGVNSKGAVVNINDNTSVKPPTEEKEQAKSKAEIETQKETAEKDWEKLRARYEEQERMRRQEESDRRARDIARTYGSGEKREGGLRDYLDKLGRTTDEMKSKDKQVATLIISPKEIELNVGESKSFSATAASADGTTRNVTGEASWSGGTGNSFKATKGGQYTISATYRGMSGSATIIVKRTAVRLYVTPKQKTVNIGEQVSFTSTAEFEDGSKDTVKAQWNPSNPFVGTEAKTYTITARYENLSDSATVTVRQTASEKVAGADLFIGTWRLTIRPKSHSSKEAWEQLQGSPSWSATIRIAKSGNSYSFTGLPGFITDNVSASGNNMTIKGRSRAKDSPDLDPETIQLKCTADGKNLDGTEQIEFKMLSVDPKTGRNYYATQYQINSIIGAKQ